MSHTSKAKRGVLVAMDSKATGVAVRKKFSFTRGSHVVAFLRAPGPPSYLGWRHNAFQTPLIFPRRRLDFGIQSSWLCARGFRGRSFVSRSKQALSHNMRTTLTDNLGSSHVEQQSHNSGASTRTHLRSFSTCTRIIPWPIFPDSTT